MMSEVKVFGFIASLLSINYTAPPEAHDLWQDTQDEDRRIPSPAAQNDAIFETQWYAQWPYFAYFPLLCAIAARASRSASLRFSVSRLSQSCLPLATASSHFTRPLRK